MDQLRLNEQINSMVIVVENQFNVFLTLPFFVSLRFLVGEHVFDFHDLQHTAVFSAVVDQEVVVLDQFGEIRKDICTA